MAKLGTKQRPAIIRVRTEARAKEIASIFTEHGWQFILGIEPDKSENISDLNRLLKSQPSKTAQKVGGQRPPVTTRKPLPKRKNNSPPIVIHAGKKNAKASLGTKNINEERCEYISKANVVILPAIITGAFSTFFLIKFLTTMSMWYLVLFILPFLFFLLCINVLIFNQRVVIHGGAITILRRTKQLMTANISDSLDQITMRKGDMHEFTFQFNNGKSVYNITPSVYKNGDKLLQQLKNIIDQENIDVEIIGKKTNSEQHTLAESLHRRKMARTIKKNRDKKNLVMGVSWYRPEQWELLQEIVEDKEHFDMTYEESVLDSENKIKQLEGQGYRPVKVEVDIEEMVTWCSDQGLSVNPENRTKFMLTQLRELVKKGIVKP